MPVSFSGTPDWTGTYNGHPVPSELRITLVLTDQAGAWQLALIHMSFIAGTPGAPPIPGRPRTPYVLRVDQRVAAGRVFSIRANVLGACRR